MITLIYGGATVSTLLRPCFAGGYGGLGGKSCGIRIIGFESAILYGGATVSTSSAPALQGATAG